MQFISYDSMGRILFYRTMAAEDVELYPGAGFHRRTHIQIAIRHLDCIKGYFRPISR